jgi:hypothetical protein
MARHVVDGGLYLGFLTLVFIYYGPVWIQGLELVWASLYQTSPKVAKQEG